MSKKILGAVIAIVCFLFFGCEAKNEEIELSKEELLEFENFGKAPETKKRKPNEEVVKIYFSESSIDFPHEPIAINIKDNKLYIRPHVSAFRRSRYDDVVTMQNTKEVIKLLEKYDVQHWKRDYTFEDPQTYEDGYGWNLWLQYEDGTVKKYSGSGTSKKNITPEKFDEFIHALRQLVAEVVD